jgi:hypothetical protein
MEMMGLAALNMRLQWRRKCGRRNLVSVSESCKCIIPGHATIILDVSQNAADGT